MNDNERGVRCPYCRAATYVVRTSHHVNRTIRRRACEAGCSDRLVSEERLISEPSSVISTSLLLSAVAELLERLKIDANELGPAVSPRDNMSESSVSEPEPSA